MSEIYTEVNSIPGNMYTEGMPLLIKSGSLLKSNETGNFAVRLIIRNLSPKNVTSVKVKITIKDKYDNKLPSNIEYTYSDLNVETGEDFGDNETVYIVNSSVFSFDVIISSVTFEDESVLNTTRRKSKALPKQKLLETEFDTVLLKEYKQNNGNIFSKYLVSEYGDLWLCSCGEPNLKEQKVCHKCGAEYNSLVNYDTAQMRLNFEEKQKQIKHKAELDKEASFRYSEEQKYVQAEVRYKRIRLISIISVILVVFTAIAVIAYTVVLPKIKLKNAENLLAQGDFDNAYKILYDIGEYNKIVKSKYKRATEYFDDGDYDSAYKLFYGLNYSDSINKAKEAFSLKYKDIIENSDIGDIVTLGSYEQDNISENGKEEIEWIVTDKSDNGVFLVSKYALDTQPYNSVHATVTWETSSVRKWLNEDFYKNAFSSDEQGIIASKDYVNLPNSDYQTDGGSMTNDKVVLLSIDQVKALDETEILKCRISDYCKSKLADADSEGNAVWMLRSPGKFTERFARVNSDGSIDYLGENVEYTYNSIRPSMWIEVK